MNVNRLSNELIERELGAWLRDETETRAPGGLVEDVFARTARMPQARRWWPGSPRGARRRTPFVVVGTPARQAWPRLTALAGLAAVALVAVVLAVGPQRPATGPGASPPSPSPTVTLSLPPSPSAVTSEPPSAGPTQIGGLPATRIALGPDAAPIDVTAAFGSVWVADIHASDVRRYDPTSGEEIARIGLGSASWFGVTDDGLWVTSQNGVGITRIDPATNTPREHLGDAPPCGAPVMALGVLWQAACDGDVFLRIDPATHKLVGTIPAKGHVFLVAAGGRLITVGPEGLARLDPASATITAIGGRAAQQPDFIASDGSTVWVKNASGVARLNPRDGSVIASFPYLGAMVITFAGDHAWITVTNQGIVEVDLATNAVRRTIPLLGSPLVAREANGLLWVTDFDRSELWRIDL
jgi:DNA-binding beta-propeller fold protein YncE